MSDIFHLIADARGAAFEHRFEDAAALASRALKSMPTCLVALRILAWSQLELDADEALATFEKCAAYDPEDALAYVGDNGSAVSQWVRAWELDPHNQAIRRALVKLTGELSESPFADAISLLRHGREDEAAEALRRLRAERSEPSVALSLMSALFAAGAQRDAFDLANAILGRHPESVKAALYVAALEDRAGRTLRSREVIARAEQVDPGLMLFADVVRQVGLQPALDLHRASRTPLAAAR